MPLLAGVQNEEERFLRYVTKINRFTAFILFPFMIGLTVMGTPLFHTLFGTKWDEAIPLFQILMIRGIFVVLLSLYSNYMLARGRARELFMAEVVKDSAIAVGLLATVWFGSVEILVWGQLIASVLAWFTLLHLLRHCHIRIVVALRSGQHETAAHQGCAGVRAPVDQVALSITSTHNFCPSLLQKISIFCTWPS